jgi:predicted transcriptional regulator
MRPPIVNRSRQEIIRDILATIEDMDLSRTKVMYRASLSYTQLKYYEDYLQQNSLIRMTEDELWTLTEKGEQYLAACKLADRILKMPPEVKNIVTAEFSAQPSITK